MGQDGASEKQNEASGLLTRNGLGEKGLERRGESVRQGLHVSDNGMADGKRELGWHGECSIRIAFARSILDTLSSSF